MYSLYTAIAVTLIILILTYTIGVLYKLANKEVPGIINYIIYINNSYGIGFITVILSLLLILFKL